VHDLGKGQMNVNIAEEDEEAIAKECVDAGMEYAARHGFRIIDRETMEGLYRAMFIARHRHGIPEEGLGGVSGVSDGMREVMRENSENIEKMIASRPRDSTSMPIPLAVGIEFEPENMTQIKEWANARRSQMKQMQKMTGAFQARDHDIMALWNCIGRMAERLDGAEKYISRLESVSEQMTRSLYGQNTSPRPEPPSEPSGRTDALSLTGIAGHIRCICCCVRSLSLEGCGQSYQ
jgi:hypothetical protein